MLLNNILVHNIPSNGQQTSFFTGSPGTFTVGSSEEELKETFLTTGIFQRKPGDSLDGRRSFKRFRREASLISHRAERQEKGEVQRRRGGGEEEGQVQRSYGGGEEQSCQSVPSRQCRDTPRRQCQMNNMTNCQMMPRKVCRRVPRSVSSHSFIDLIRDFISGTSVPLSPNSPATVIRSNLVAQFQGLNVTRFQVRNAEMYQGEDLVFF